MHCSGNFAMLMRIQRSIYTLDHLACRPVISGLDVSTGLEPLESFDLVADQRRRERVGIGPTIIYAIDTIEVYIVVGGDPYTPPDSRPRMLYTRLGLCRSRERKSGGVQKTWF